MNNRFEEIDKFIKSLASEISSGKVINEPDIYGKLCDFGLTKDEKENNGQLRKIHYDLIDRFKNSQSSVCGKVKNWLGFREKSIERMIAKGLPVEHEEVKLYIPANADNMLEVANGLFSYLDQNSIVHDSKMSENIRADNLVVRVSSTEDASKVSNYINENFPNKIMQTNPFLVTDGQVGIASDGDLSYNERVSTFLNEYFKSLRAEKKLQDASMTGFKDFMEKKRDSIYISGNDLDFAMQLRDKMYYYTSDFRYLRDNKNIMDFIIIALDPEKGIEEFKKLWEENNTPEKKKQTYEEIMNLLQREEPENDDLFNQDENIEENDNLDKTSENEDHENSETSDIKEYDEEGYDKDGYNSEGYDRRNFNREGINKETGTKFDSQGFDKNGYDEEGYGRNGYNRSGYDRAGYDRSGYDRRDFNREGINKYTGTMFDTGGCDKDGYYEDGFNGKGINKETGTKFDSQGFNKNGYDEEGYGRNGYDRSGYDRAGYDRSGYDRDGYNRSGYNCFGWDREGFEKNATYNRYGYDREGHNKEGYNKEGYDRQGYDKRGFDKNGINKITNAQYDEKGYDKEGYDENGYDEGGFNRWGYDEDGYDRAGFNDYGINRSTKTEFDVFGYDIDGRDKYGYTRDDYEENEGLRAQILADEREELEYYEEKYGTTEQQEEVHDEPLTDLEKLRAEKEELEKTVAELKEKLISAEELLKSYESILNADKQNSNDAPTFGEE